MKAQNKEEIQDILAEFEQSGLDIDSFMKMKLKAAGRSDVEGIVSEINEVSKKIDESYADLKHAKANGESRQSWLKRKLESVFAKITPHQAGKVVGHLTVELSGNGEEVPEDAVYNEINADDKIEALDQAVQISVCRGFLGKGEKE